MASTNLPGPSGALLGLAEQYFSLLARSLPACCLSDEFHSLPRVESAWAYMDQGDCLDKDLLAELSARTRAFVVRLEALPGPEPAGLKALLGQSMKSFLLHWDELPAWQRDPSLYLKVAFIGLDHALDPAGQEPEEREALYRARLEAIPQILDWGLKQVNGPPEPARVAALEMVGACRAFLSRAVAAREEGIRAGRVRTTTEGARKALEALDRFEGFLKGLSRIQEPSLGPERFARVLSHGFGWQGDLKETREILEAEAACSQEALARLARRLDEPGSAGWLEVYEGIRLPPGAVEDPLSLYREEVGRLEAFFGGLGILPMPPPGSVRVEPTPSYLEPIRATASYAAPAGCGDRPRVGRFFVQVPAVQAQGPAPRRTTRHSLERAHREYRYLSAHETYPGHHLLDWARLHLPDPIRRRIESPLFYEGWACYAEQLLDETGYMPDPRQCLIRLKRELWRAARGLVDLDLHTGRITLERGAGRLEALGIGPEDARRQARRIPLTPGYQLCYTLGKRCFVDLRARYVPPLSLQAFHERVLACGQVPPAHIGRALAEAAARHDG